jgi:rhodanese-related sulfurtransferase
MKKIFPLLFVMIALSSFSQQTYQTDTVHKDISVQQADSLIQANTGNPDFIIIDVRTPSEYSGGYIIGAININYYATDFGAIIDTLNRDKMYLLYCGSGNRSAKARDTMIKKHFVTVYNMLGGMGAWLAAGYPTSTTTSLYCNFSDEVKVQIFPNPVTDISTIEITAVPEQTFTVEIYDAQGRFLNRIASNINNEFLIDKNSYEAGIYLFRVLSDNKTFNQGKFIVEK